MEQPAAAMASRVLHVLADLAPSAEERSSSLVVPTEWFRWLPLEAYRSRWGERRGELVVSLVQVLHG